MAHSSETSVTMHPISCQNQEDHYLFFYTLSSGYASQCNLQ